MGAPRRPTLIPLALLVALVTLAGCGDSDTSSSSTTAATDDGKTLVAALGDSITSGSPGYDPDPAAATQLGFGQDERSSYEYWAEKANPDLEFRNCGVFGERTDEIATRFDECADGADALIIQGGINDIAQSLSLGKATSVRTAQGAAQNISRMVDEAQAMDLPVAVTDVLPWNNGHPQADAAIAEINKRIEKIAAEKGIEVLPFHDTLEDSSGEQMKTNLTADGDHPSIDGYKLLGEKAFELPAD